MGTSQPSGTLLENLSAATIALLYVTKFFDYFLLFDETLGHIELCNASSATVHAAKSAKNFSNSELFRNKKKQEYMFARMSGLGMS